jgi:excisionase family DNA binding protein
MTAEMKAALRVVAAALPADAVVPVPAGHLVALLGDATPTGAALLTVEQVAARLAVGPQAVYRRQRELGAVKVGRAVRFPAGAVERYLARRKAAE